MFYKKWIIRVDWRHLTRVCWTAQKGSLPLREFFPSGEVKSNDFNPWCPIMSWTRKVHLELFRHDIHNIHSFPNLHWNNVKAPGSKDWGRGLFSSPRYDAGNLVNVLRIFPAQALNFAFKDNIKAAFKISKDASQSLKLASNIVSGGVAGTMSLLLLYSLDYARTRFAKYFTSVSENIYYVTGTDT